MTHVLDQIESYPINALSGSYTDHVFYGDIFRQEDTGFKREVVASKIDSQATIKILQKNFLYSERLRYYTGTLTTGSIRVNQSKTGAKSQNLFTQVFSNEKYFDSFVPTPTDIAKASNIELAFIQPGAGTLDAAPNFGLPSTDQEVPIIFGNQQIFTSSNIVNTTWTASPFPFQKKYQGLQRVFNSTFLLPEQEELSVDFVTGDSITPVSRSNVAGSVYYTEKTPVTASTDTIFNYITEDQNISNQLLVNGTIVGTFSASHAMAYKPSGLPSRVARAAIDEAGGFYYTTTNTQATSGKTTTITKTYENPDFVFKAVSASVTAQWFLFGGWTSTVRWFAGGRNTTDNRAIVARFDSAGTFVDYYDVIGASQGIVYGLANEKVEITPGSNQRHSGRMVAVGRRDSGGAGGINGFISTSTNHSGSSWNSQVFGTDGGGFKAVTYDRYTGKFWVVGDGGYVYSSSNSEGTAWEQVAAVSTVYPIDYNCITTNDKGTIVLAGKRTAAPSDDSIVQLFFPTTTTMNAPLNQAAPVGFDWSINAASYVPQNDEFVLVGNQFPGDNNNGYMIRSGSDGVDSWTFISSTQLRGTFHGASDGYGWTLVPDYTTVDVAYPLFVGEPFQYTKDSLVFRTTDLISDEYTDTAYGSVNNLALMPTGAVGLSAGSQFTRSTLEDGLKSFYGFGKGFSITFDGSILTEPTGTFSILPRLGIAYRDFKIIQSGLTIESVRLIGPRVQGYNYGIMNVVPQSSKMIWRRGRYGQFRDMLEQRPNAKYYLPPVGNDATRYDSVVKVSFVTGSNDFELAKTYMNATSSVDFNWYDSGIYDSEYRSGQPFFDQRDVEPTT